MQSVTLVVDESGAKGFSDNREAVIGELGVIAGLLIPSKCVSRVETDISSIVSGLSSTGKLHITDLDLSAQQKLREELFSYLLGVSACCVYEAIYVEGLYSHQQLVSDIQAAAKAQRRSKIKLSGNDRLASLHQELFGGAFGKGVAFCIDHIGKEVSIDVITDRVDKSVLKSFSEAAQHLLNVGSRKETRVSGFDPVSKTVLRGSVTTEITTDLDQLGDFSGIRYNISQSESVLTLAADVVANSVHHHLKSLQASKPGCALNTADAIAGHPLANIVYGVTTEASAMSQVADAIFRHPMSSSE
ncbi:MAG: hypothetical protein RLZZ459_702 [Cyanobacteriota bacterium]|jgi:hypothetical protein